MIKNKIYATTDIFTLLRNGRAALIGSSDELGKRYENGICIGIKCVTFDFEGDGNEDKFFFEDDKLVYYFISLTRKGWLGDLLYDCATNPTLKYDTFILAVVERYTLVKLGFADY
jgi:hypothetical protein